MFSLISLLNCLIVYPVQKNDSFWILNKVTMDYYKLNHVVAPVEAAVSDVFILEQITQILHMICSYVYGKCFFPPFL